MARKRERLVLTAKNIWIITKAAASSNKVVVASRRGRLAHSSSSPGRSQR